MGVLLIGVALQKMLTFYPTRNCKCFLFACVRPAGNRGSVSGGSEHAEAADWYLVSARHDLCAANSSPAVDSEMVKLTVTSSTSWI